MLCRSTVCRPLWILMWCNMLVYSELCADVRACCLYWFSLYLFCSCHDTGMDGWPRLVCSRQQCLCLLVHICIYICVYVCICVYTDRYCYLIVVVCVCFVSYVWCMFGACRVLYCSAVWHNAGLHVVISWNVLEGRCWTEDVVSAVCAVQGYAAWCDVKHFISI